MTRDDGGRGLNSIHNVFLARIMSLSEHIKSKSSSHPLLKLVVDHEKEKLLRVSNQIAESLKIKDNNSTPKDIKKVIKDNHKINYSSKKQHGLINKKQQNIIDSNKTLTNSWLKLNGIPSHTEGYIIAIQQQEINTRALQKKREHSQDPSFNDKCRHCNNAKEDIFHLLSSCSKLSTSMYLPMRHDQVGKLLYNAIIRKHHKDHPYVFVRPVWTSDVLEIWWDIKIETSPSVPSNKPDIVVWNKTEKICSIIDVCVPLDENIGKQEKIKIDKYTELMVRLQRLYSEYS